MRRPVGPTPFPLAAAMRASIMSMAKGNNMGHAIGVLAARLERTDQTHGGD